MTGSYKLTVHALARCLIFKFRVNTRQLNNWRTIKSRYTVSGWVLRVINPQGGNTTTDVAYGWHSLHYAGAESPFSHEIELSSFRKVWGSKLNALAFKLAHRWVPGGEPQQLVHRFGSIAKSGSGFFPDNGPGKTIGQ